MVVPQYIWIKKNRIDTGTASAENIQFSFTDLYLDSLPELDSNPNILSCLMMSELPSAIISAFDFTLSGYLPSEV